MIKTLKTSFKIDMTYAINSFIYNLKHMPIFKDLFPDDSLYKSVKAKKVIRVLGLLLSTLKIVLYKILYFSIIYMIAEAINPKNIIPVFLHIYFIFTIIGIFINNKILSTSTKKYFSIVLFNMNAEDFMKASLWQDLITNFILHSICLLVIVKSPIIFVFTLFAFLGRIIGERINLLHYKKFKISLTYNYPIYWTIILFGLASCLLPLINIKVSTEVVAIITVILLPIAIICYKQLLRIADYKLIYKKLNTKVRALNSNYSSEYSRQSMVDIKDKDKKIDEKKLKNKKGYDLFNTIFFERHKEILLRSAKWFAGVSLCVIIGAGLLITISPDVKKYLNNFLLNNIAWFVIIMYFINRGSIITQAMFYNCDHSMLTFNFYRNPKVILNVFKTRVLTVSKVNLIPAVIIAVGLPVLLYLSGGTTNLVNYIAIPIFIITLSIFFSIHYLVIYYLFQPYDKNMKMKSFSYSLISLLTYVLAYSLIDFKMSTILFSILAILATVTYCIIALILVYKKAPTTFKIK